MISENRFDVGTAAPADGNGPTADSGTGFAGNASDLVGNGLAPEGASYRVGTADGAAELGPNFERLEAERPELVNALRELVRQYRQEGIVARRNEIRRVRQARMFWQGQQYAWWNPNDMNWHMPYEQRSSDDRALEEMPRYQFVTNFYQGFGLSFVAVISQDVPSVRFYPQSAQSLGDIAAAKAASDVAELVERNNRAEELLTAIGYFLWTDGKLGAYVRYVEDGARFGFREAGDFGGGGDRVGGGSVGVPRLRTGDDGGQRGRRIHHRGHGEHEGCGEEWDCLFRVRGADEAAEGGEGDGAAGCGDAQGGERARGDFDCWWVGVEHAGVGE